MAAYRSFVVGLVVLASCKSESSHPPVLAPSGGSGPENPVLCGALRDAGSSLAEQGPGVLSDDAGVLGCLGDGTMCPLVDVDGGACDGGADAALPYATCTKGEWVAECVDAGAPAP